MHSMNEREWEEARIRGKHTNHVKTNEMINQFNKHWEI